MKTGSPHNTTLSKNILRIAIVTAFILLLPLVAMQFTQEMNWGLGDFVTAGALLFGTGLTYELAARGVRKREHRIAIGAVLGLALLVIWAELAVGIFGS